MEDQPEYIGGDLFHENSRRISIFSNKLKHRVNKKVLVFEAVDGSGSPVVAVLLNYGIEDLNPDLIKVTGENILKHEGYLISHNKIYLIREDYVCSLRELKYQIDGVDCILKLSASNFLINSGQVMPLQINGRLTKFGRQLFREVATAMDQYWKFDFRIFGFGPDNIVLVRSPVTGKISFKLNITGKFTTTSNDLTKVIQPGVGEYVRETFMDLIRFVFTDGEGNLQIKHPVIRDLLEMLQDWNLPSTPPDCSTSRFIEKQRRNFEDSPITILNHPFLWPELRCSLFFHDFKKIIGLCGGYSRDNDIDFSQSLSNLVPFLKKLNAITIPNWSEDTNWMEAITSFSEEACKTLLYPDTSYKKEDYDQTIHLIRLRRNADEHPKYNIKHQRSESSLRLVGDTVEDYHAFFDHLFPNLMIGSYRIFQRFYQEIKSTLPNNPDILRAEEYIII